MGLGPLFSYNLLLCSFSWLIFNCDITNISKDSESLPGSTLPWVRRWESSPLSFSTRVYQWEACERIVSAAPYLTNDDNFYEVHFGRWEWKGKWWLLSYTVLCWEWWKYFESVSGVIVRSKISRDIVCRVFWSACRNAPFFSVRPFGASFEWMFICLRRLSEGILCSFALCACHCKGFFELVCWLSGTWDWLGEQCRQPFWHGPRPLWLLHRIRITQIPLLLVEVREEYLSSFCLSAPISSLQKKKKKSKTSCSVKYAKQGFGLEDVCLWLAFLCRKCCCLRSGHSRLWCWWACAALVLLLWCQCSSLTAPRYLDISLFWLFQLPN